MKRKRRGVRKKINGNVYAAQVQRLESVLVAHMQELSLWQDTVGHKREREQILLDMILHQELMLQLLQAQQAWLASNPGAAAAASSSSSSRDAPQQPWVAEWAGGRFRPNESTTTSYIASLLLAATPVQLLQAIQMTSESWSQYKHDHFQRLAVLLELLTRQENFSGLPSAPVTAAEAAAAAGESLQVHPAALLQAPAAAGSSLPAAGPAAEPELQELDVPGQLDEVVDEGLLLSFLSLFHNHLMLIQAAMNRDLSGNTPTDAPPSHWRHVVRRVNLTERQLLHMRLATEEFERLSQSASAEAGDLVLRANCPSLYLAAEAQQRLRAEAASGDGSPATSSGTGDGPAGARTSSLSGGSRSTLTPGSSSLSGDSSEREATTPLVPEGSLPLSSEAARAALAKAPAAAVAAAAAGRGRGRGRRSSSSSATTGQARARAPATTAAAAAAPAGDGAGALPPDQQEQQAKEVQQADREGQDALQEDLQRHVRHRFLHMLIMGMFCFNTLSRVQIARMTVYCYPYYPDLVSFAAQAAEEHKEREQQRRQQQQAGSVEQRSQQAPQPPQQQPLEAYQVYEAQQLEQHMQRRSQLLEQQQQLWLEQLGKGDKPERQQQQHPE